MSDWLSGAYRLLSDAATALAPNATLRFGGVERRARVSFEGTLYESTTGDGAAVQGVESFSVDVDYLTDENGTIRFPTDGDEVVFENEGARFRRAIAKNSTSGRRWDWFFQRPGRRIIFYALQVEDRARNADV